MKPCCIAAEQRCVDIDAFGDEWWCGANDGILGPEGACCRTPDPDGGVCTNPEQNCWRCLWEVMNPDTTSRCCIRDHPVLGYQWFENISVEQCELCGGELGGSREDCAPPVAAELRPCCDPVYRRCTNVSPTQEADCEAYGGTLGPKGTCCRNPYSQPRCELNECWLCGYEIPTAPAPMAGSCCLAGLNYQWFDNIYVEQCYACNAMGAGGVVGDPYTGEEECQAPIPEPECIDAPRADRPNPTIVDYEGTRLQWTLDTIGTVVFGMSKIPECQVPIPGPECRGIFKGYQYPLSTHLIRPKQADTPIDSCGHAGGRKTMLDDGYVYVETCSKPDWTSEDSFRRSYGLMRTFLPDANTPLAEHNRVLGMQDGYQYAVACIRLPWWTEALYRSHTQRCGGEPI